jgi:hypothetical protein
LKGAVVVVGCELDALVARVVVVVDFLLALPPLHALSSAAAARTMTMKKQ